MRRQFAISVILLALLNMVSSHAYTGKILTSDTVVPHNQVPEMPVEEVKKSEPTDSNAILTPNKETTGVKTKNDVLVYSFEQLIRKIMGDASNEIHLSSKQPKEAPQAKQPTIETTTITEHQTPFSSIVIIGVQKPQTGVYKLEINDNQIHQKRNKSAMNAIRKEKKLFRKMHKRQRRHRRHEAPPMQQIPEPIMDFNPFMINPFFQMPLFPPTLFGTST